MKVHELIKELQKMPQDLEVVTDDSSYSTNPIKRIVVEVDKRVSFVLLTFED